jgi:hypothetical protein
MGGEIQWQALPLIADVLGIEDIAVLVHQLAAIRDFQQRQIEADQKR